MVGKLYQVEQIKDWLMVPPPENGTEDGASEVQNASLAAVLIISAPFAMVKVSIFSFLIGLAIYQGFIFTKNLDSDTASNDSRDSFIAFMVGTGMCTVFFWLTFSAKDIENTIRSRFYRLNEQALFTGVPEASANAVQYTSEKTSEPQPQLASTVHQQEIIHQRKPAYGERRVSSPQSTDLATMLEAAAQAHVKCAEMDRRVALAFSDLSAASHTS